MTKKKNNKPSENAKNIPVAEALISLGLNLAQEKNMTLGELIGHYEVAKIEVYSRITAGAQAQASSDAEKPGEDADNGETVAFSPDAAEGKA